MADDDLRLTRVPTDGGPATRVSVSVCGACLALVLTDDAGAHWDRVHGSEDLR